MANNREKYQRTTNRVLVSSSDEQSSGRRSRSRASHASTSRTSSRNKTRSARQSPAQPTKSEITRNRVIAIAVIVVLLILLVSLFTCVAKGLSGSKDQKQSASQASVVSGVGQTVASQASAGAASPKVPEGVGVEDPWVEGGRFTTGDDELDHMIKDFCDSNSNPDLNAQENAYNAYCSAMWIEFVERENNQHPTGTSWDTTYAKQALAEYSGNCYEQVALGEYVLKYFGYSDAQAEPCLILRQSGEYGDHGLLYVTDLDGRKCLCDPAFGANGWMKDADIYTVKVVDVGQDPEEFKMANFEEVVKAPWLEA